ncbi:hypothetical protein [Photobacterium leiognathi]|uniref:Uncharacterized protein n=1 Tax=Photobacterium leiognathi lrivu.4.1 TaxID=1248232 RepID=V5F166_PHOLE|nr:hypothetical protein [Photobacterium leiognathi]GAD28528.1 conserved hypothetical protein [Photobacterium leiognathi lrivu.4.1]
MSLNAQEQTKYEELTSLQASGTALKPAQKVELKKLKKKLDQQVASKSEASTSVNTFGKTSSSKESTSTVNPKAIRFVEAERQVLTRRAENLVANNAELVVERLGSIKKANETMLVRAAVLALADMSDEDLVEYMKQAQRNMIG